MRVRPLEVEDLPAAAVASAAAFALDISRPAQRARWLERVGHPFDTDPEGCFVAEADGRIVGVAQVIVRDAVAILSLLAVDPAAQGTGAGRALMDQAMTAMGDRGPGLIVSSNNPHALRLYALAGFRLLPAFQAEGPLRRVPISDMAARVRDDAEPDFEALAALSRAVRGAQHTPELRYALRRGGRLLTLPGAGFAIANPGQAVWILVARDPEAATALLWRALEVVGEAEGRVVRWILERQGWAIDVAVRAGLRVSTYGALAVRGEVGPLAPYLPTAAFG